MFSDNHKGRQFSRFEKTAIKIASASEEVLRICPPHDLAHVIAIAELLVFAAIYQASVLAVVGHQLFAAPHQFRPEIVLIAIFLAIFVLKIDSFSVVGSQWRLTGNAEIRKGGVDISGGSTARIQANIFLALRIFYALGLAQLTAILVSTIIFNADITSYIDKNNLHANAHLVSGATALVDEEIKRASTEVSAQETRVEALSSQVNILRQRDIDPSSADPQVIQQEQEITRLTSQKAKADEDLSSAETFAANELAGIKATPSNSGQVGNGPKRRAAMELTAAARLHVREAGAALDAARNRLESLRKQAAASGNGAKQPPRADRSTFESTFAEESKKLAEAKERLSKLIQKRNDAIRIAIDGAPDHVERDEGFLARIAALEHIANADPKIAIMIALIDVVSFGLELAAVLAKVTSLTPTVYATLIAKDAYIRAVRAADEIAREVDITTRNIHNEAELLLRDQTDAVDEPPAQTDSPPDGDEGSENPFISHPKRPRGRPRKPPPAA